MLYVCIQLTRRQHRRKGRTRSNRDFTAGRQRRRLISREARHDTKHTHRPHHTDHTQPNQQGQPHTTKPTRTTTHQTTRQPHTRQTDNTESRCHSRALSTAGPGTREHKPWPNKTCPHRAQPQNNQLTYHRTLIIASSMRGF